MGGLLSVPRATRRGKGGASPEERRPEHCRGGLGRERHLMSAHIMNQFDGFQLNCFSFRTSTVFLVMSSRKQQKKLAKAVPDTPETVGEIKLSPKTCIKLRLLCTGRDTRTSRSPRKEGMALDYHCYYYFPWRPCCGCHISVLLCPAA